MPEVVSGGVLHSIATGSVTETTSPVLSAHSPLDVAVLQPRIGPDRLTRDENDGLVPPTEIVDRGGFEIVGFEVIGRINVKRTARRPKILSFTMACVFAAGALAPHSATGQVAQVRGQVVDGSNGSAVISAFVTVDGTQAYDLTDSHPSTTQIYDRRARKVTRNIVERISISARAVPGKEPVPVSNQYTLLRR